jgi:NAD(P)-dependent dehydrogenase (short-subunit alcohol dehydrogenase family)
MDSTQKKSVLITGCSSGIGRCLALGLHERGYNVIASCRKSEDVSALTVKGLIALQLDLDSSESISRAANDVLKITGGSLFGLINNGAYGQPGAVEDLTRDALRRQFETNVFGTQELTNLLIPVMRAHNQGRIIQISSVLGFICLKFRGAYNASKYALEALTDTMRLEHADSGIRFSLIEPGPISSKFRQNAYLKYQDNIDRNNSVYQDQYSALETRLTGDQPVRFNLPPEAVLKAVIHALEARRPRIRYRVTVPTKVFASLKRLLPDKVMDRLLSKS